MILITGFDPFGGAESNPSWEAVCRVPDRVGNELIRRIQLPTAFDLAAATLQHAIRRYSPSAVVCCGVAQGRRAVTPELVAINYRDARIPDNAGWQPQRQPIHPQGPAAYMTSLPIHAMVEDLQAAGIPAQVSLSAGAFVCNDVYYALLAGEEAGRYRGLFIHVPGTEALDPEQTARGLTLCLERIAKAVQVSHDPRRPLP